jgi:hypothetical protein
MAGRHCENFLYLQASILLQGTAPVHGITLTPPEVLSLLASAFACVDLMKQKMNELMNRIGRRWMMMDVSRLERGEAWEHQCLAA